MTKLSSHFLTTYSLVAVAVVIAWSSIPIAFSQCTTIDFKPDQWPSDATVYFNFGNITDPVQRQQIQTAIDNWNAANSSNNSRVQFSSAPPPQGARTLTFQNGSTAWPLGVGCLSSR